MADTQPLTREDLRDELQRFALDTLKQDLPDIVSQVREELRDELHRCLLQWSPAPPPGLSPPERSVTPPPAPGEPAHVAGVTSSWRQHLDKTDAELPPIAAARLQEEALQRSPPGNEEEEEVVKEEAVQASPLRKEADVEMSPTLRPSLQKEALQGSPPRSSSYVNVNAVARARASGTSSTGVSSGIGSDTVHHEGQATTHWPAHHDGRSSAHWHGSGRHSSGCTREQFFGGLWAERSKAPVPTGGSLKTHSPLLRTVEHRSSAGSTRSLRSSGSAVTGTLSVHRVASAKRSRQGALRMPAPEGSTLARLVNSAYFDYCTGLLILLNAASIGVQADYMARNVTSEVPATFRGLELSFCAAFTVELLLRIYVYKKHFFSNPDWVWNIFDCLLVLLQLVEEFMSFFALHQTTSSGKVATDLSIMRILRILRLIRIIRLVRILRLIGELRTIVASIAGSLRSLCWTVLLLMMLMYLVGVYLTQLTSDHRVSLEDPDAPAQQDGTYRFFGSLGSAMLALYQVITGGLNWHLLADPLMNEISPWLVILLGLYIAFSLFALMNVVTGVFVESALATAKNDRDRFLLEFVRKLFMEVDKDASGSITWEEFSSCLASKEMQLYFEAFDLDIQEAKSLFILLDLDESGEVEFEEFVNGCFRLRGPAKALDLAMLVTNLNRWCHEVLDFAKDVDSKLRLVMEAMKLGIQDTPQWPTACGHEGSVFSGVHQHLSSVGSRGESCNWDVESDPRDLPKLDFRKQSPLLATGTSCRYFEPEGQGRRKGGH